MSRQRATARTRRAVVERAGGLCEYCRSPDLFSPEGFSIEHIRPQARGGKTLLGNLALSCQGCNNAKHTKTKAPDPTTGVVAPLYNPRKDRWSDHFAWSDDGMRIVGLTSKGRATVQALHLNRTRVVNLRGLLMMAGRHPPPNPSEE